MTDTITILSGVTLAIYDIVGLVLIAWAIWTACTLNKKGR
jgi:hypothetical protein